MEIVGLPGAHGNMYAVKTDAHFNKRADANPTPAGNPAALKYPTGVAADFRTTSIAHVRKNHKATLETLHTQKDVTIEFQKVIIVIA